VTVREQTECWVYVWGCLRTGGKDEPDAPCDGPRDFADQES